MVRSMKLVLRYKLRNFKEINKFKELLKTTNKSDFLKHPSSFQQLLLSYSVFFP